MFVNAVLMVGSAAMSLGSELDDVRNYFRSGDFDACTVLALAQVEKGVWNELWPRMLVESHLATGKYASALKAYEKGLERFPDSIRLRLLGVRVYQMNNNASKAKEQLAYLDTMLFRAPWRFSNKSDLVPVGEYFLARGEDPKEVLSNCFDQAIKFDPRITEAYVATARLALEKNDDKIASQSLDRAIKLDPSDPEIAFLAARSWGNTDASRATEFLKRSLELNARYVPSLLYQAENRMSAEDYEAAENLLAEVEKVNPSLPRLWALRASIAHLRGQYDVEGEARRKALLPWSLNPEVDHIIGKQLAMHYRFTESVEYQRRALTMDPEYTPAKTQLAQDLLRLGETQPGWELVEFVRTKDPYDVTIFNLKQLKAELDKFATLEAPGFVIRMDSREAKIYGNDVVQLLSDAREVLTKKYATELAEPIYVEIFPKQKEFAIRTFGLPGGEGFLGVCFGRLITANSPAALNVDSNWQSVLWHEYCHVVTLQKTKNKMPRWLSEGISVYEERQRNPIWGQTMDPIYREMILGTALTPVSQLSGAFLQPKTPMHLQFAYFESSMVVEYWIEKYGLASLRRLLDDLAIGMPAAEALKRAPGTLELLDSEFRDYALEKAAGFGKGADFDRPAPEVKISENDWLEEHPNSLWALRKKCEGLVRTKRWDEALTIANRLRDYLPDDGENEGVYALLAGIHRGRGDETNERIALAALAERSSDCREALMRLIEIDLPREDWKSLEHWCQRMQAIDPLRSDLQQARATVATNLSSPTMATSALSALLELSPTDPADVHYRLAMAQHSLGQHDLAKRSVLKALEEAPRYRDALDLLVAIVQTQKAKEPE